MKPLPEPWEITIKYRKGVDPAEINRTAKAIADLFEWDQITIDKRGDASERMTLIIIPENRKEAL